MSYNKDTDYQAKINEAAEKGDYVSAAKYEQSRNEKIDSENLGYQKTNKYAGWLDETDYGTVINQKISEGASKASVADILQKRVQKASTTEGLQKYAYDDIYQRAVSYIMDSGDDFKPSREYENTYSQRMNSALRSILNRKEFSYDVLNDELYRYYLEMYQREGKRAMEDTLGKVAENTGGLASSYATTAASQAYNYYSQKSADIIPELYSDAYGRYIDALSMDIKELEILQGLSNDEYDRFYKDREFDYQKYIDRKELELEKTNADRDYELEKLNSDRNYELEKLNSDRNYELEKTNSDRDYDLAVRKLQEEIAQNEREDRARTEERLIEEALTKWKILGYLDEESAKVLNLPAGLKTSDYRYKLAQEYKIYNK